jgi:hypothetical protein
MELENHMSQSMHCQLDEATSANGLNKIGQKVLMALDRKASIHLSSIWLRVREEQSSSFSLHGG